MPIVPYLVAVSTALFCVICYMPAIFGPPGPMPLSTAFHSISTPPKISDGIQILTVREGPAPDMTVATASSAEPQQNENQHNARMTTGSVKPIAEKKKSARVAVRTLQEQRPHRRYVQYSTGNDPGRIY